MSHNITIMKPNRKGPMNGGDREIVSRKWFKYRTAMTEVGTLTEYECNRIVMIPARGPQTTFLCNLRGAIYSVQSTRCKLCDAIWPRT